MANGDRQGKMAVLCWLWRMAAKKEGSETVLPITAVEFDPQNARRRTERSSYTIRESLQNFGPLRSLVGQKLPDGRIIIRAGNGTLEEAGQIGIDKIRVVERKPDELIVVVADDLDERQWKSYAIADNRASDLSDWHPSILDELISEGIDLDQFWRPDELDELLKDLKDGSDSDLLNQDDGDRSNSESFCECPSCGYRWNPK